LGGLGFGEILALVVIALLIFGPDKLPKAAAQAGRALRQLRGMATSAQEDLRKGLGPEFQDFDVADLNPRRFVRKHLLEGDEDDLFADDPLDRTEATSEPPLLAFGERPPFDSEAT
jgi:sec-independent protein translocase protein TatB